jgi:hypothetical protein
MQKILLLLIPIAILIVIVILLSTKKKDSKICPTCQECKTYPAGCYPCPGNVNLDKLLYKLPEGGERYPSLSRTKSLSSGSDIACDISNSNDIATSLNIDQQQYGILQLNQDTATKDKYKYVWRPYQGIDIAYDFDENAFSSNQVVGTICDDFKSNVVFGKEIQCSPSVACPVNTNCKLDGNENDNNVCV